MSDKEYLDWQVKNSNPDITEVLRIQATEMARWTNPPTIGRLLQDAAIEIDRLRQEIRVLQKQMVQDEQEVGG